MSASAEDLQAVLPEPSERLSPMARRVWRLSAAFVTLPVAALAMWARRALELPVPLPLAWAGVVLAVLVFVGIAPEVSWRRWRYEIRPLEIDLRRGLLVVRRTLVPIARVQHVDTERGPLQQALAWRRSPSTPRRARTRYRTWPRPRPIACACSSRS